MKQPKKKKFVLKKVTIPSLGLKELAIIKAGSLTGFQNNIVFSNGGGGW